MSQEKYIHPHVTIAHVALGTNKSDNGSTQKDIIARAIGEIVNVFGDLSAISRLYSSPCFPKDYGPDYVNAALTLEVIRSAEETLAALHQIESDLGRVREGRWGSRVIDLDLLSFGDQIAPNRAGFQLWHDLPLERQMKEAPNELILPHPRLHERSFVLVPLAEIAPDWVHPVLGQSVTEMLGALPQSDRDDIRPL